MALSISKITVPNYIIITPARALAVIAPIRQACLLAVIPARPMDWQQMAKEFPISCSNLGSTKPLKDRWHNSNSDQPQLRLNKLKFKILMPAEQCSSAKLSFQGLELNNLFYTIVLSSAK
jgi:hypothetical protein